MKIIKKMNLTKSFLIILIYLFSSISCQQKGAKAIYVDIDVSKTSEKYDTYVLDFKSDKTPPATYWSLAYWEMDITEFIKEHPDAKRAGAYAGLQTQSNSTKNAIMSFWDVFYTENGVKKRNRAKRIYPTGEESTFDNEGEGTNFFPQYKWLTNVWYRFVIHSWVDQDTKKTYVGEWIHNLDTEEWTLLTYFDVGLKNSFLVNGFGFFLENFNSEYFGKERNFQLKNMYILDHSYKKWISINTTTLSSEHHENSQGTHEFGHTSSYIYGSSGLPVADQELYDASMPERITGTINQPDFPAFPAPILKKVYATLNGSVLTVNWTIYEKTPPCYHYFIEISRKNSNGKFETIGEWNIYRPEITSLDIVRYFKGEYLIYVECDSILDESDYLSTHKTF